MVKNLARLGNSSALIFDKTLMELLEIDEQTPLKLTVENRRLIVEPLDDSERKNRVRSASRKLLKDNAELYRRLAK
jgi:antitoxin component of MazEF toxin-antitoxin module